MMNEVINIRDKNHDAIPKSKAYGQAADEIFGNIDFETIGEHLDAGKQDNGRLYWPFAVSVAGNQLIVADTGNHR